jgi:hypothetical protein
VKRDFVVQIVTEGLGPEFYAEPEAFARAVRERSSSWDSFVARY